jgi:hypothetical protein
MTKKIINTGTAANSKNGDSLRTAFTKINSNFTELYAALGLDAGGLNLGAFQFSGSVMSTTDSTPMVLNQAVSVTGDLTVGGDLLPNNDLQVNLGSPSKKWHSLYVGTGSVYIGDAKLSLEGGTLNSSVGFSTDSLTIGGNVLTVNGAGVLESTGGINGGAGDRLTNGDYEVVLEADGKLKLPNPSSGEAIITSNYGTTLLSSDQAALHFYNGPEEDDPTRVNEAWVFAKNTGVQIHLYNDAHSDGDYLGWSFKPDGNLQLPVGGDIVDSNGASVLGGGGGSISDFGEGFTDSLDAGKITTSKLYNENPNQGLNNQYTLEVTNGGVVTLPDGSIINGATLKTIAGNYAGITAGPASPAGKDEDSWVWVDNDGATIATKYSTDNHQWKFDNSGALTFPQGTTIATADGSDAFVIDGAVDKDVQIYTYSGETARGWTFGTDGLLTLPSGNTRIGDVFSNGGGGIVGSTGTTVGVLSQGQGGYAALQWLDDPEDATSVAAVVVNSPIASTSGTVQIATGLIGGPTAENVWEFDANGVLTLPANGTISYAPDNTDNWDDPAVNTIQAALDELAARVTALQNFEIDGGNAYTPALGELLIDGNGA